MSVLECLSVYPSGFSAGLSRFSAGLSHSNSGLPHFLRQIVSAYRVVVADNLPEKIGFEAGAFPYDRFGTSHLLCLSASLVSFFNRLCYAGPLRCCELLTARCLMARKVMWSAV